MRLGIDLDGVVANFTAGWIRRYNDEFGANIDASSPLTWGGAPDLTHFTDLGEFWRWVRNVDGSTIFRTLDVYEDAIPTLERLAANHEIVIVTTKPRWAVHDTFAWIADQRLPTREVHMTRAKWEVDVDVYLDDGPHVIEELVRRRAQSLVCRYVRSWNDPVDGAIDVESWAEFEAVVDKFAALR